MKRTIEQIKAEITQWEEIKANCLKAINSVLLGGQSYSEREGDGSQDVTRIDPDKANDLLSTAETKLKNLNAELENATSSNSYGNSKVMFVCGR